MLAGRDRRRPADHLDRRRTVSLRARRHLAAGLPAARRAPRWPPGRSSALDTTLTDTAVGAGATVADSTCDRGARSGRARRSVRTPTCVPAPGSARAARPAPTSRSRRRDRRGQQGAAPVLRRRRDDRASAATSAPPRSSSTTTAGHKHRHGGGDDVRIGSDTMFVAPVAVGDGALHRRRFGDHRGRAAGALGVGRARQRNIEGWVARAPAVAAGGTETSRQAPQ